MEVCDHAQCNQEADVYLEAGDKQRPMNLCREHALDFVRGLTPGQFKREEDSEGDPGHPREPFTCTKCGKQTDYWHTDKTGATTCEECDR